VPNIASAKKNMRKSRAAAIRNRAQRSALRTALKNAVASDATAEVKTLAVVLLDRAARDYPDNEAIARERALFRHRQKDCRGAVAALTRFEASTTTPETLNDLALFDTCLEHREAVERLLARSLALKPDQPQVARLLEVVRAAGKP